MQDSPLLVETNALLQRLLQLEDDQRAEAERAKKEFEERFSRPLVDRDEEAESANKTIEESTKKMREQMEESRRKEEEFRAAVISEYQEQTRLLREILEIVKR
ncbi:MAG: hypothetical protein QE269_00480 [Fimbriimonas sp.]|nr:hypothetical protein [Fimbriimonas sp.]